jgi:hypothetical protein
MIGGNDEDLVKTLAISNAGNGSANRRRISFFLRQSLIDPDVRQYR